MSKKLKAKAVIFDRDGVIINTEGIVINSIRKAFAQLGFTVQDEDIQQTIGRSSRVYKDYFLKKWDFSYDEYRDLQKDLFYKNLDSAPFFDEIITLIKRLYSQKVPLAVTTSAGRDGTILILKKAGVEEMVKVVVSKEDCENLKPHPEPYILTAKKLGVLPEFCVAIEDTALGVESAKNAGIMCIAIPNEHTKDQDFSQADLVLQSAKEVEGVLEVIPG